MECAKIRDKFSSLLEGELDALGEQALRVHLASCPECQKDFEKFEKTFRRLHSFEEAEVPDGFLSGIYKKMDDRKKMGLATGKTRWGWSHTFAQLKLPAQAVAMVTVIFLALYITKMMPGERMKFKEAEQTGVSQLEAKKEAKRVAEEGEKDRGSPVPLEAPQTRPLDQKRFSVSGGKEVPKAPLPAPSAPKGEASTVEPRLLKEGEIKEGPSAEEQKKGKQLMAKEKVLFVAKPPREIILRVSQREKAVSQIYELVKQSGGEIEREEGNALLASLPADVLSEFEGRLAELGSSKKLEPAAPHKDSTAGVVSARGVKRREPVEKDRESRIPIRILLLQE